MFLTAEAGRGFLSFFFFFSSLYFGTFYSRVVAVLWLHVSCRNGISSLLTLSSGFFMAASLQIRRLWILLFFLKNFGSRRQISGWSNFIGSSPISQVKRDLHDISYCRSGSFHSIKQSANIGDSCGGGYCEGQERRAIELRSLKRWLFLF